MLTSAIYNMFTSTADTTSWGGTNKMLQRFTVRNMQAGKQANTTKSAGKKSATGIRQT